MTVSSSMLSNTSHIHEVISATSASLNPRVVTAGDPIRRPLVTKGDFGSFIRHRRRPPLCGRSTLSKIDGNAGRLLFYLMAACLTAWVAIRFSKIIIIRRWVHMVLWAGRRDREHSYRFYVPGEVIVGHRWEYLDQRSIVGAEF